MNMKRDEFERLVAEGYEKLPQWVREKIKNVAILVEDEPSREDRKMEGLHEGETLLGLYKGIPLSERGELYGVGMTMPDTITIYQKPTEDETDATGLDIRDVVKETIYHEFAHHFGMDEEQVEEWERKKWGRGEHEHGH